MTHSEVRVPIIFPQLTPLRVKSVPVGWVSGIPEIEGFGNIPPLRYEENWTDQDSGTEQVDQSMQLLYEKDDLNYCCNFDVSFHTLPNKLKGMIIVMEELVAQNSAVTSSGTLLRVWRRHGWSDIKDLTFSDYCQDCIRDYKMSENFMELVKSTTGLWPV